MDAVMLQEFVNILFLILAIIAGIGITGNILYIVYKKRQWKKECMDAPSYREWCEMEQKKGE